LTSSVVVHANDPKDAISVH